VRSSICRFGLGELKERGGQQAANIRAVGFIEQPREEALDSA
jgi:hypothetical protein